MFACLWLHLFAIFIANCVCGCVHPLPPKPFAFCIGHETFRVKAARGPRNFRRFPKVPIRKGKLWVYNWFH